MENTINSNIDSNIESFKARFKECDFSWDTGTERLKGHFFYLPYRDGELTTNEFIDYLIQETVKYTISFDRRKEKFEKSSPVDLSSLMALKTEIKSLFSNTKTSGDFGELIIYIILRDFFNAPQIANKMTLKTSSNVAYFGAAGLHLGLEQETLLFYLAESKLKDESTPTRKINIITVLLRYLSVNISTFAYIN